LRVGSRIAIPRRIEFSVPNRTVPAQPLLRSDFEFGFGSRLAYHKKGTKPAQEQFLFPE
jgi:hypothetical protein